MQNCSSSAAVAKFLDHFARFSDPGNMNAFGCAAVDFANDYILRNVDQSTREVARVSGPKGGIRESLAGTVRRNEVLENAKPLMEVRSDRQVFDDVAEGIGHEAAHPGKLGQLLDRASRAASRND